MYALYECIQRIFRSRERKRDYEAAALAICVEEARKRASLSKHAFNARRIMQVERATDEKRIRAALVEQAVGEQSRQRQLVSDEEDCAWASLITHARRALQRQLVSDEEACVRASRISTSVWQVTELHRETRDRAPAAGVSRLSLTWRTEQARQRQLVSDEEDSVRALLISTSVRLTHELHQQERAAAFGVLRARMNGGRAAARVLRFLWDTYGAALTVELEVKDVFPIAHVAALDFCVRTPRGPVAIELDGDEHFTELNWYGKSHFNDPSLTLEIRRARDTFKTLWWIRAGRRMVRLFQQDVWNDAFDWHGELRAAIESGEQPVVCLEAEPRDSWAGLRTEVEAWSGSAKVWYDLHWRRMRRL